MGQTPAKAFPMPTPYGQSPDMGVLAQAKAATPAPQQNFLPLNPSADQSQQQQPAQTPAMPTGFQNQLPTAFRNNFRIMPGQFYG